MNIQLEQSLKEENTMRCKRTMIIMATVFQVMSAMTFGSPLISHASEAGSIIKEVNTTTEKIGRVVVSDGSHLNLRAGAGLDQDIIGKLHVGEHVQITGKQGEWYEITIPDQSGYVYEDYLRVMSIVEGDQTNEHETQSTENKLNSNKKELTDSGDEGQNDSESLNASQALTPEGNLTLVDDCGTAESAGKQFITLVSKNGNYFYLVIDRDEKGNQNVHFMNLVDEADLYALLDDDVKKEIDKQETEQPIEQVETPIIEEIPEKNNSIKGVASLVILLVCGGVGIFYYLNKKKVEESEKPDPDEDYVDEEEYREEMQFPEETEMEELNNDAFDEDDYDDYETSEGEDGDK